jgi:hypothetical protein
MSPRIRRLGADFIKSRGARDSFAMGYRTDAVNHCQVLERKKETGTSFATVIMPTFRIACFHTWKSHGVFDNSASRVALKKKLGAAARSDDAIGSFERTNQNKNHGTAMVRPFPWGKCVIKTWRAGHFGRRDPCVTPRRASTNARQNVDKMNIRRFARA